MRWKWGERREETWGQERWGAERMKIGRIEERERRKEGGKSYSEERKTRESAGSVQKCELSCPSPLRPLKPLVPCSHSRFPEASTPLSARVPAAPSPASALIPPKVNLRPVWVSWFGEGPTLGLSGPLGSCRCSSQQYILYAKARGPV